MSRLQAIADKVVIRLMKKVKTVGGIIVPDTVVEKITYGTVVSVGDEVKRVKEGDVVKFFDYAGVGVEHEDRKYIIVRETDIYAILVDNSSEEMVAELMSKDLPQTGKLN
jgi:chaperonin GroES